MMIRSCMRYPVLLAAVFLAAAVFHFGCGGTSASPTTPTSVPVAIEGLDGESGIAVDSEFKYTSTSVIDTTTVTSSTFFMVQAVCSETNCSTDNAISATISCESAECTLTPTSDLSCGASYCICMTTDVKDVNGTAILSTDLRVGFTTAACSNPSGVLTVTSVKDAEEASIGTTGSTGIFPTSFEITFSDTTDDSLVTTAGNVTLVCGGESKNITVAAAGTADTYTVTVTDTDMYKYALAECILTVTTGTGLAANDTYTFTNGCAVNDTFAVDSQRCWTIPPESAEPDDWTWHEWDDLIYNAVTNPAGPLTFDTADGTLDYNSTRYEDPSHFAMRKTIATVDASGFEIVYHFDFVGGFDDSADMLFTCLESADSSEAVCAGMEAVGTTPYCTVLYSYEGELEKARVECSEKGEYYIKAIVGSGGITGWERDSGASGYDQMGSTIGVGHTLLTSVTMVEVEFEETAETGQDNIASIYDIVITGITVAGQY